MPIHRILPFSGAGKLKRAEVSARLKLFYVVVLSNCSACQSLRILLEVSYCTVEHLVEVVSLDILVQSGSDSLCVSHLAEYSSVR